MSLAFSHGESQLNSLLDWLAEMWKGFIDWLYEILIFILDALLWLSLQVFEKMLDGFRLIFSLIDPPQFIQSGISQFTSAIPPDVGYLLGATGFDSALGIIGVGYTFRLTRKVLTLFQW